MSELGETIVAETLYRAGYTEPRLRQFWGSAIADALVRNNAAPAIHFCGRVLRADAGSNPFERNLAALAMLFHFHQGVSAEAVRAALGEKAYDAAVGAGLIESPEPEAQQVKAPFAITPYDLPPGIPRGFRSGDENLYLVSDHGTLINPDVLDGDFVLGLGGAGRTLVSLTPRDHVVVSADIGTGCGIQALLLARHSDRVIATDISERALHLAALSARLNGVTTIEFRAGSLLDPLDEPVDLLVSNPPFVITPRAAESSRSAESSISAESSNAAESSISAVPNFEYRDGGMAGDLLVRALFTAIPKVLKPGGRSVCLGNWEVTSTDPNASAAPAEEMASVEETSAETVSVGSEPSAQLRRSTDGVSSAGPESWVADPETSVFVIEREVLDPVAYAETWIRDGGIPRASRAWNAAMAAWMDDFASRDVAEVVFGYVIMAKADEAERTEAERTDTAGDGATRSSTFRTRVRTTSAIANNPQGIGSFVDTLVALRSWLESASAEEIATTAFTRSPDLVERRHFVPGDSEPNSITLEQGIGFGQVFDLDTALAGFVSVADGSLTLRQTAGALAQLLEVNPTALEDQLIAQVRQLAAAGVLLPVTE